MRVEWRNTVLRWKTEGAIVPNMALLASVNNLCQQHPRLVPSENFWKHIPVIT